MLATLVLAALAAPQSTAPQGLEGLVATLEERTAKRRKAARDAWVQHKDAFLLMPTRASLEPLEAAAPEIQDPALEHLQAWLDGPREGRSPVEALLLLLGRTMDGGGADRLVALLDRLPDSPAELRATALRQAVERGGLLARQAARERLNDASDALRHAAVESLLLYAPLAEAAALAARYDPSGLDADRLGEVLSLLAERPFEEGQLVLDGAWFEHGGEDYRAGLVRLLRAYPQEAGESFLVARATTPGLSTDARSEALQAFVAGARAYRWRDGERDLQSYFRDEPRSPSTEAVAWALWKLENATAKKFLLDELEDQLKDTPDDWRVRMRLARRQVNLDDHADAYRNFRRVVDTLDDGLAARRLDAEDWFYASRAAAGARRGREAGEWLQMTGWTPARLAPYRELPEFADYLDKEPFKRLFAEGQ